MGTISYRVVGILWGGAPRDPLPASALRIRIEPGFAELPVQAVEAAREAGGPEAGPQPWILWSHTFSPPAPGRYRIQLAVRQAGVHTRRLDAGYYTREVEIAS